MVIWRSGGTVLPLSLPCHHLITITDASLCVRDGVEARLIFPRFPTEFRYLTLDISDSGVRTVAITVTMIGVAAGTEAAAAIRTATASALEHWNTSFSRRLGAGWLGLEPRTLAHCALHVASCSCRFGSLVHALPSHSCRLTGQIPGSN